jgi:hypothetical protein
MVLRPSHNTEPTRTLATRHCLVDVRGVMRRQVVPNQDPVIICPHHSKLLYLRADMITEILEDVYCCAYSMDTPDPMPRTLNTPMDVRRKSWIPRLDGKKDSDLGTMVIVPIFPYPENPQRPTPCAVALLRQDPELIHVNQLMLGDTKNTKWGWTVPKAPDTELDILSLRLVCLC